MNGMGAGPKRVKWVFHDLENRAGKNKVRGIDRLPFCSIEVISQNHVHEIGLRDFSVLGFPANQFLVVILNDKLFVVLWKCPRAYIAQQVTTAANVALDVIALFAKGLVISQFVRSIARAGNFVVGTEFDFRFALSATRASEPVAFLESSPILCTQFRARLALLTHFQALELVTDTLFNDRGESLFALKFANAPENVLIRGLSLGRSLFIDGRTQVILTQNWAGDSVSFGPESLQEDGVIAPIRRTGSDEIGFRIDQPLRSPGGGFIGNCPRRKQQTFTCARFSHFSSR